MNGPSSAVGAALAARLRLRGRTATPKCTDQRAAPVQFLTGVPVLDREDSLSDHGTRIAPDGLSDGSLVDIVGFSGSGKTALLHHISAHIIAPSLVTGWSTEPSLCPAVNPPPWFSVSASVNTYVHHF